MVNSINKRFYRGIIFILQKYNSEDITKYHINFESKALVRIKVNSL